VKDFARGCMRTYLILKDKAARWNADKEIQTILKEVNAGPRICPKLASTLSQTRKRFSATSSTKTHDEKTPSL